ncbi:MAG: protein SdhA, partial [Legionella sp.]
MLDAYIKLLASFKERQISTTIIDKVQERVFAALADPRLHEQIAPYFSNRQTIGVPFSDYAEDPNIVSQIKKLINALYYARLTFVGLEELDLTTYTDKYNSVKRIFADIMDNAYEAASLATHFDVSLHEMFPEIQFFFSTLDQYSQLTNIANEGDWLTKVFENYPQVEKVARKTHAQLKSLQNKPIAKSVGEVAGMAVKQMQPSDGSYDYEFLTQFVSILPGYIDKFTQLINTYSSQLAEHEPSLNNERLAELRQSGLALLNDLEHLKGNSVFVSFKFLKYIHIINNIITLTMSSLEQIGNLSESSQDLIRDNIAQLKYGVLPNLFGLIDKIEVNFMLKPGTLATPLMDKIKPLYATLIYYA